MKTILILTETSWLLKVVQTFKLQQIYIREKEGRQQKCCYLTVLLLSQLFSLQRSSKHFSDLYLQKNLGLVTLGFFGVFFKFCSSFYNNSHYRINNRFSYWLLDLTRNSNRISLKLSLTTTLTGRKQHTPTLPEIK